MLNSFYAQMFVQLQEHLAITVPELRWVDFDLGQLEAETRPSVSFPCLLIDFNGTQFSQLLRNIEITDNCIIQFRLGFAPYSNTNHLTPADSKALALQYFEIENKVYKALKGFYAIAYDANNNEFAICQPLNRVTDGTERRDDGLRVRVLLFSTAYQDETDNDIRTGTLPPLAIEPEIVMHPKGVGFDIVEDDLIVYP